MMPQVCIVTHGDLDGMVSAILVLSAINTEATVQISNTTHLAKHLEGLANQPVAPAKVFITDIPLAEDQGSHVAQAIAHLAERGADVHIYDHHVGWDNTPPAEDIRKRCATFCVKTGRTTAAAVIWRKLLPGDRKSQRWLRLLAERGRSADPEIARNFRILAALMQRQHWPHTEAVLRSLATGKELSREHVALAAWYEQTQVKTERHVASQADVITSEHGTRIGWIDLRTHRGHLHVAPHIIEMFGVDLVASVIFNGILVGGEGIDRGIDLQPLHGQHTHAGIEMTIAGHRSPIRIDPANGQMDESFVNAAREFLLANV